MPSIKGVLFTALIAVVVVGLYHNGALNMIPPMAGPKK